MGQIFFFYLAEFDHFFTQKYLANIEYLLHFHFIGSPNQIFYRTVLNPIVPNRTTIDRQLSIDKDCPRTILKLATYSLIWSTIHKIRGQL
jgi:hypothetical protein